MTTVIVRLKAPRERAGLSQQALAGRVGISRQALNAIEGGKQAPSVTIALALAKALRCRVEDLFADDDGAEVLAELAAAEEGVSPTARVALGQVAGRWVAHPLHGADYAASDGMLGSEGDGPTRRLVAVHGDLATLADNVLVAGCAPLLGTLARGAAERFAGARMRWVHASSSRALDLLEAGHVHVAGIHHIGDANADTVGQRFGAAPMLLVNLVTWRQGLLVPPGNPLGLSADDLLRPDLRVAWREPGAGARALLLHTLEAAGVRGDAVPGGPVTRGHVEVARAVATGAAEVGVAIEAAAVAFGLDFVPLTTERFDLALRRDVASTPAVERVLSAVDSRAFRAEASAFGGYATEATGHTTELRGAAA